jgi:hypothetical protein
MYSKYLKKLVPGMTLVFIAGCTLQTNGIPGPGAGACTKQPQTVQGCCSTLKHLVTGPGAGWVVSNTAWHANDCGASPSDQPSPNWCTFTEIDSTCVPTLVDCNGWQNQIPQGWQQVGSCTTDQNNCQPPQVDQSGTVLSNNVCTIAQD